MTVQELQEITAASGLEHARFCAEQNATQVGRDVLREVFAELERMEANE